MKKRERKNNNKFKNISFILFLYSKRHPLQAANTKKFSQKDENLFRILATRSEEASQRSVAIAIAVDIMI